MPQSSPSPLLPLRRASRGLRVSTLLAIVAIVPLAGSAWVTWAEVAEARAVAAAARNAEASADRAVALAQLDAAIFDEMIWSATTASISTLGLPESSVSEYVGGDLEGNLELRRRRVDGLVDLLDDGAIRQRLERAREGSGDLSQLLTGYGDLAEQVQVPLDALLAELPASASADADGDRIMESIRTMGLAVELREAVGQQFYAYFATLFDVRDDPATEVSRLIDLRARADRALAELERVVSDAPGPMRMALLAISNDVAAREFGDAVTAAIDAVLAEGAPAAAPQVTLDAVLADLDPFAGVLAAMEASGGSTMRLLNAAVGGLEAAITQMRSDAEADIVNAQLVAALLTVATVLAVVGARRVIVIPLRALRRSVHTLQDETTPAAQVDVGGPMEVRAAGQAIQDAASHFHLVTRQARALAAGELDAPVLDEQASGGLGDALQYAVGTLRGALAQQDEFRRRLAHEASHDGLTKLANRNASMAQLTRSLARTARSQGQLAVLFIDLDRFKEVNDVHGHHAGDAVLTTVAQRLVTGVREGDHVGRLGGDEFVVIAEPVTDATETVALAERIVGALSEPIDLGSVHVSIGASVGIALTDGRDLNADELLRDADLAVYRAKEVGRGGIEVCDEDLRARLAESADLEVAIRQAIDRDEFVLHYQPIIDTGTESVHALEALVRWRRPGQESLIPPDRFIGFAERSRLIVDLDRWVINAVARQIARWEVDPDHHQVPVAINVSGRHLAHDQFVQHVLQPLADHGVDPSNVIIEVTESALLEDLAAAAVKLQQLRDHGVLISIDDFGTGYTSLAHLRSLPVDILKIDRSFTHHAANDAHEASIVKLIIDTGHLLGATITAEGVETIDEVDKLAGLGADHLQGFYFARPQPSEQLGSNAGAISGSGA